MKSLMLLWKVLLEECGERCDTSTTSDYKLAASRFKHEGVSFLAITLPIFAKDFERSLELGKVSPDLFAAFKWRGELPSFLGGFMDLVFDRTTGLLLETPSVGSILSIRQLCAAFGKIQIDCSEERKSDALRSYLQCESDVKDADERVSPSDLSDLLRVSALLFRDVFTRVDRDVHMGNIVGKHGPGKTADRLSGNGKYDLAEWPERLEREFPYGNNSVASPRYIQSRYDHVTLLELGAERPVRVVQVPKTPKTPRTIAIEPTAMQFMQQGFMEVFVKYLETDKTVSGMIGFTQQGPNQVLAREGSSLGELATLDLSEASDRVSDRHVLTILSRFPALSSAIAATRSRKAVMPDGSIVELAKFASMGSALCFPFEAMVFLSLVFLGIEQELNCPLTRKTIRGLARKVRVYGDDIVVPVRFVYPVISTLELFGFKVNAGKSFWNGKFRESCGKDYYDGTDVSLIRVRRELPASWADRSETCSRIISAVALRNQMYVAGYTKTAEHLDQVVAPFLKGHYPELEIDMTSVAFTGKPGNGSPILGRFSYTPSLAGRIHADYQIPLVRGWYVNSTIPKSAISGEGALLKFFLKRGEQPFADERHLERQGRPKTVNIKLGWRSVN